MTNKQALARAAWLATATLGFTLTSAAGDRDHHDEHYARNDKHSSYDPAYNVCRGVDPRCYHDWAAAERVGVEFGLEPRRVAHSIGAIVSPVISAWLIALAGPEAM